MRRRALLAACLAPAAARAQPESWPARPLRAIVPFPPGSATDGIARFVAERLTPGLGQPVVVENVVGGNGLIAARQAARAAPDGYSLFFATNSTHAASVHLAREPGFDPVRGFLPVTLTSLAPLVLMVRADFPARTVGEFLAVARQRSGSLNYGTGNIGSLAAAQLLKSLAGIEAEQISYRGTPAAVTDLLAGRLQFLVSDLAAAGEHIRAGTLRALGATTAERIPMLPDVPTLQEAGVPGYEFASWVAVFLPAGSPSAVQDRLNRGIRAILGSEGGRRVSLGLGLIAATTTPEELAVFQRREIALWGRIAQAAGLPRE
ncbi:Bug family tripartite tricarboxylate transporter substrate binding protein [Paracraurococcus lichenis]|uniref:Tripartite tricarboxylate transporter substrate-binding protein n=1 Tax=Paracraurococcus lichenis TaxID=3064888 RepID=A0ABT9ECM5_9PROT|nr:tripartite tricarboxylate transporter substrate-binding protein [Paracraurococcus sp. LOR1-02]MDO9713723.1 tripartite tricarboxylate transporter substrate-binding protein [Paracraurococcus sp. LOR1-02]